MHCYVILILFCTILCILVLFLLVEIRLMLSITQIKAILNICDMADLDWLMFKMDKSEYSSSPCVDLWVSPFYLFIFFFRREKSVSCIQLPISCISVFSQISLFTCNTEIRLVQLCAIKLMFSVSSPHFLNCLCLWFFKIVLPFECNNALALWVLVTSQCTYVVLHLQNRIYWLLQYVISLFVTIIP